jgi:hypothetical protein
MWGRRPSPPVPGRPKEEWQPLEEHLRNVAEKAAEFAGTFADYSVTVDKAKLPAGVEVLELG